MGGKTQKTKSFSTTNESFNNTTSTPGTAQATSFASAFRPVFESGIGGMQGYNGQRTAAPTDLEAGNYVAQPGATPQSTIQRSTADNPMLAGRTYVAPNAQEGIDAGMAGAASNQAALAPLVQAGYGRWGDILSGGGNPALADLIAATQADYAHSLGQAQNSAAQTFGAEGAYGGTAQGRFMADQADQAQRALNTQTAGLRFEDYLNQQQMLLNAPQGLAGLAGLGTLGAEQLARYGGMRQENLQGAAANDQANQNVAFQNQWNQGTLADTNTQAGVDEGLWRWAQGLEAEKARIGDLQARSGVQQDIAQTGLDNQYAQYASQQDAIGRQLGLGTEYMNLLRAIPGMSQSGTATGTQTGTSTTKEGAWDFETLQKAAKVAAAAAALSDRRLKTDMVPEGGGWWKFRFLWDPPGTVRRGVMAQEVREWLPEAVVEGPGGWLSVNYSMLGA